MKLRNLQTKDAEAMLEWMKDDFVVQDLKANFSEKTIEDCLNFIRSAECTDTNYHLAITENDEYMGTVSLKHIEAGEAEFGITIRRCAMGKGFSAYAMKEIIRIGFEKLGLSVVYWCVSPKNVRACKFYKKEGYSVVDIGNERAERIIAQGCYTPDEVKEYLWYKIENK